MNTSNKTKAIHLYEIYKNYSEVARQMNISPETVRITLDPKAKQRQIERDKNRDFHSYYINKKNKDPAWYERILERTRAKLQTPEEKEKRKLLYEKAKKSGKTGYKGLTASRLAHINKRRSKKVSLNENYTNDDMDYTKKLFQNKCAICGTDKNICFDHWYPLSKGYILSKENAVLLCRKCNAMKYNKMPLECFSVDIVNRIESVLNHSQGKTHQTKSPTLSKT